MFSWPLVYAKGLLIGIANIIPGVSGGTFALLLGIYGRLIDAIRAVGPVTLRRALGLFSMRAEARRAFAAEWKRIDGTFLLVVVAGALTSILASSRLIKSLLEAHPAPTLAFFVGLILPSVAVPYAMMKRRGVTEAFYAVLGALIVVAVALAGPGGAEGKGGGGPAFMLLCGVLAISAMILPGISGSFLLLVLGEYTNVLEAINGSTSWVKSLLQGGGGEFPGRHLMLLGGFCAGAVIGLTGFTRLLSWTLRRFHDRTMAFLIGLIVGSLWTLWPFKDYSGGDLRSAPNVWPNGLAEGGCGSALWILLAFVAGLVAAVLVMMAGRARADSGKADSSRG